MATAPRPWITCHVLETVAGKPAANMKCTLTLLSPTTSSSSSTPTFTATTNSDGRVTAWDSTDSSTLESTIETAKQGLSDDDSLTWAIKFQTGEFYGAGKTFWPEVVLTFYTKKSEAHYHVPLLLGPWSYTTYRGS